VGDVNRGWQSLTGIARVYEGYPDPSLYCLTTLTAEFPKKGRPSPRRLMVSSRETLVELKQDWASARAKDGAEKTWLGKGG
jgi:hypothetical protein